MAQDAVNKVTAAEAAAAETIAAARERARLIISVTEKECREALLRAEKDAEEKARELVRSAQSAAEKSAEQARFALSDEHKKLSALAAGRMDKAAAVIAERVVKG